MADMYEQRSYAQVPIGFGHKPGIVVVDYFTGDPGCSAFATGHHVCRVKGARPALLRVASRDDVLDLPVLFRNVDLAISAQSMLERTEGLEYLTISRAAWWLRKPSRFACPPSQSR